jgi:phosphoadenosine phosphosulfate reductase
VPRLHPRLHREVHGHEGEVVVNPVLALERVAADAAHELETASAEEVLRWAGHTFGDRFCITSSMGDTILAHVASRVIPGIDVLFLDTGYHFVETIGTRDAVAATYDVRLLNLLPDQSVAEQDATYGPRLHDRDPDLCCALRKVAPLERTLASYDAWATGVRRDESATRAQTPVVGWDARRGKVKVNPLARWTQADVEAYAVANGVLMNPLLSDGYASIGCAPCTRRVLAGEDARAGRWAGFAKTECGINS